MKHGNKDLLVHSNGTVEHIVIMNIVVGCEVNLYNYPFASDFCAIALNVWAISGCGMFLTFGNVSKTSANRGDWLTEAVELNAKGGRDDRNYLWVSLKMRPENPFLSLVLPSILIILADVVNHFKVKLVLSFIMFLNILKDLLPGGGQCSPIIKSRPDITVIKLKASEEEKNSPLQNVVKFLNKMAAQDQRKARHHRFANKVDLICFCIYLTILIVYTVVILYFSFGSRCEIDQLDFWEN